MSTIGKIFLIFNLFLAGGFLFWASSALEKGAEASKALEAEKAAHQKLKAELEGKNAELTAQLTTEKGQKETFRNERDQAKSESDRNKEDLLAARRANDQLGGDVARIQTTLGDYNNSMQQLQQAKDAAIAEARQLERERDEAKGSAASSDEARRSADEALAKANRDIADLEKQLKSAHDAASALETQLANVVAATGYDVSAIVAQQDIDAKVVQVDMTLKPGLVALSAGSSQGVKKGYTFDVYNGTTYKGQVRVESVHPDMCSALIVFANPGQSIGAGDSASTQL